MKGPLHARISPRRIDKQRLEEDSASAERKTLLRRADVSQLCALESAQHKCGLAPLNLRTPMTLGRHAGYGECNSNTAFGRWVSESTNATLVEY